MSGRQVKASRREIRKALGSAMVDDFVGLTQNQGILHTQYLQVVEVMSRGFFGRFKWLLFGR